MSREEEQYYDLGTPECFGATLRSTRELYGVADFAWAHVIRKEVEEYREIESGKRNVPSIEELDSWLGAWRLDDDIADNLRWAAKYPFKTTAFDIDFSSGRWRNLVVGAITELIEENRQMSFLERTRILYGGGFRGFVSAAIDRIPFIRNKIY